MHLCLVNANDRQAQIDRGHRVSSPHVSKGNVHGKNFEKTAGQ